MSEQTNAPTERDELTLTLVSLPWRSHPADVVAGKILAAGYRKPRTVTTVEELDTLPQKTVVIDCDNDAWQKHRTTGVWSNTEGATQNSTLVAFYAPLTVLHEGAVNPEYHQHHGPQSSCNECEPAS